MAASLIPAGFGNLQAPKAALLIRLPIASGHEVGCRDDRRRRDEGLGFSIFIRHLLDTPDARNECAMRFSFRD
ncbi:MAG: hypothetical protein ACE148_15395 [Vicinamibacterales bacterium]